MDQEINEFTISAFHFNEHEELPQRFQYMDKEDFIKLEIANVPDTTLSLAIALIDRGVPGENLVHWIQYNIPPSQRIIDENTINIGITGLNSWQERAYHPPFAVEGEHTLFYRIFALQTILDGYDHLDARTLLEIINIHTIDSTDFEFVITLDGHYAIE